MGFFRILVLFVVCIEFYWIVVVDAAVEWDSLHRGISLPPPPNTHTHTLRVQGD